ncbi:MAG: hypothetical protein LBG72_02465 [Spirochaetaceae bacterium]|nr:hypothetical protein [Spirochaetaceae bacterium]
MKKFSGTIAMAMVVVMLAWSSTSCLSYVYRSSSTPARVGFAIIDIVTLPFSLIALAIVLIIGDNSTEMESQTFMANLENKVASNPEYLSLVNKLYSLPEAELTTLRRIANSISKAEQDSLIERISVLSEVERSSLFKAYVSLPETEIISSIQRINSFSDTERVALIQHFKSLSEPELASLLEELKVFNKEIDTIAAADYSAELTYATP